MFIKSNHKHAAMSLTALCIMCGVYTGVVFNTLTLYMEPIIIEFPNITRTQFAMIITITGATNAVLSLFVFGPLVARLKLRKCIVMGALSICAALILFSHIRGLTEMYLGGLLLGFGITFGAAGAASVGVNIWFAKRTAMILSIPIAVGFAAGIIFSPLVGKWIVAMGWRASFRTALAVTAFFSVAVALLYRDSPEEVGEAPMFSDGIEDKAAEKQEEETGVSFREMFRTPQFYFLCLAYFIAGVVIYSVMSNMAIFSADHGFDSVTQGVVLSAMFTASAVMMIPAGAISDKYGTRITMLFCLGALILALIILMQDSLRDIMLYFAAVLVGIAYVGTNGPATISVREGLGTKDFDKKMPVVLGFMFAGVSLGNPILQCFYDIAGSYSRGFAIYIAGAAAAAVLIFLGTKPVQKL